MTGVNRGINYCAVVGWRWRKTRRRQKNAKDRPCCRSVDINIDIFHPLSPLLRTKQPPETWNISTSHPTAAVISSSRIWSQHRTPQSTTPFPAMKAYWYDNEEVRTIEHLLLHRMPSLPVRQCIPVLCLVRTSPFP